MNIFLGIFSERGQLISHKGQLLRKINTVAVKHVPKYVFLQIERENIEIILYFKTCFSSAKSDQWNLTLQAHVDGLFTNIIISTKEIIFSVPFDCLFVFLIVCL